MKIAVIVLNYNNPRDTINCIESLKKTKGQAFAELKIIVVDNKSTDNSVELLSNIKDITVITNEANLGYSGGNNVGIRYALKEKFNYIIILNNDTYVDELFLKKLMMHLSNIEIASPKIYFAPGHEYHRDRYNKAYLGKVIWYAGGEIDWKNIIGVHLGVDEIDKGQFIRSKITDYATGACMIVKREVFEKVGLFDEKYFLYLEDMDFCMRAKKAGFNILFLPQLKVWHKNAATSGGSGSSLQDYYISRNRLLFAFKFASLRVKFAVLKQVIMQIRLPVKRAALLDFLTLNFGKNDKVF